MYKSKIFKKLSIACLGSFILDACSFSNIDQLGMKKEGKEPLGLESLSRSDLEKLKEKSEEDLEKSKNNVEEAKLLLDSYKADQKDIEKKIFAIKEELKERKKIEKEEKEKLKLEEKLEKEKIKAKEIADKLEKLEIGKK